MKKTLFTLNVNGYSKEITNLTYPYLKRYAAKIHADFHVITERKFPTMPPVYEKLQIFELGKHNDWNLYFDADALVHPDTFDLTEHLSKDTVMHHGLDLAGNRFNYDRFFRRDGRHIGSCNWLTVASDWCIELWQPLDIPYGEAFDNIHPTVNEANTVITPEHLIDDYTLSRNIAKYGLKVTTVFDLLRKLNRNDSYFYHEYTITTEEKVARIRDLIFQQPPKGWGLVRAQ